MRLRTLCLLLASLLTASEAHATAASWYSVLQPTIVKNTLTATGDAVTWDEPSTNDSATLKVDVVTECINTGSTDFTVYAAKYDGTKEFVWWGPVQDGQSCAPAAGVDTCGSVELVPGWYVFDPDATAAHALCKATGSSTH